MLILFMEIYYWKIMMFIKFLLNELYLINNFIKHQLISLHASLNIPCLILFFKILYYLIIHFFINFIIIILSINYKSNSIHINYFNFKILSFNYNTSSFYISF